MSTVLTLFSILIAVVSATPSPTIAPTSLCAAVFKGYDCLDCVDGDGSRSWCNSPEFCFETGNIDCELACNGSYTVLEDNSSCPSSITQAGEVIVVVLFTLFGISACFCLFICCCATPKVPQETTATFVLPPSPIPPLTFCTIASNHGSWRSDLESQSPRPIEPPKKKRKKHDQILVIAVSVDE